jgi:hypothetical protein
MEPVQRAFVLSKQLSPVLLFFHPEDNFPSGILYKVLQDAGMFLALR